MVGQRCVIAGRGMLGQDPKSSSAPASACICPCTPNRIGAPLWDITHIQGLWCGRGGCGGMDVGVSPPLPFACKGKHRKAESAQEDLYLFN